ncbi:imidazoleglycerol-phosphate dehydratase HisB [bacterium]|nr:imidazoleglycerol-phosphate dehydratase HisB [bacterium]
MSKRRAEIKRKTKETNIQVSVNLDGCGDGDILTSIPFMDHMLNLFAKHSKIDMKISASGDTHIDDHHTVEDIGICLGDALKDALGEKVGIKRYGCFQLPMDETLMEAALDISGRPFFVYNVSSEEKDINGFKVQLVEEFLRAFSTRLGMTLHVNLRYGKNAHHIYEAVFKCMAVALRDAVGVVGKDLPSTKGKID